VIEAGKPEPAANHAWARGTECRDQLAGNQACLVGEFVDEFTSKDGDRRARLATFDDA
jgi:hypothetical protein